MSLPTAASDLASGPINSHADSHSQETPPKYNGTAKPEDWLADYVTAVNIAGGNK